MSKVDKTSCEADYMALSKTLYIQTENLINELLPEEKIIGIYYEN
jgi:hypothetical protein